MAKGANPPPATKESETKPPEIKEKNAAIKLSHSGKDEKLCEKIVIALGKEKEAVRVLLQGEAGIGKTRLAKLAGQYAVNHDRCFLALCLHLNQKFEDVKLKFEDDKSKLMSEGDKLKLKKQYALYQNIASQLFLYSDFEETEVDDRDEDEEEEKTPDTLLNDLKKKIIEEIKNKDKALAEKQTPKPPVRAAANRTAGGGNDKTAEEEKRETSTGYLLLILDDEGYKTSEDEVMNGLGLMKFLKEQCFPEDDIRLKLLVTKRNDAKKSGGEVESQANQSEQGGDEQDGPKDDDDEIKSAEDKSEPQALVTDTYEGIKFETSNVSKCLLESINDEYLTEIFVTATDWNDYDAELMTQIVKKCKKSPGAIVVLAKSLNQITSADSSPRINEELKKKITEVLSTDRFDPSNPSDPPNPSAPSNPVLDLAYELLETYGTSKDDTTILHCFWHSLDFFAHCGCAYYRELITQWILEGYFDPVRSVEKAYKAGHSILMQLINRGMLKIQENNVVVPEMAMSILIDPRFRGHLGNSRLGFSRVYGGDKRKGIGKTTQIDDMIKTVQAIKGDKITTILVGGDRLRRVTPEKYFKNLGELEVLALFEPTLDPFIPALLRINKSQQLRVLVIRDCDLLDNIEDLKELRGLQALEVSGASSLKEIPDKFFTALSNLESLHLSKLQITTSPSSISELMELHCLIIRDCPLLEDLPDIQELSKLEVVDISGARGLQTCFDNTKGEKRNKSKNKNFYHLTNLQLLDFSESQIERLPIFQDSAEAKSLRSVTRLLLRDCSKLRRLPSLKPLSGLQILDLSGTSNLVEMLEVCFEDKKELKTLDLSRTNLSELADTINELCSLNELLLRKATKLETIPKIDGLVNLEVIDVSGSSNLNKIDGSFEKMHYLRIVNLSGTQVKDVPELPKESCIVCEKILTLWDGTKVKGATWEEVKAKMSKKSEEASTSEISEKKPEEVAEIQPSEPLASDGTEKKDVSRERLLQVPKDKTLYEKTLLLVDSARHPEVMEINETNEGDDEALAKAEYVSFVDINSARLTDVLNKTKPVKGCWIAMSMDIKDLFSGVAAEQLESLETLSITNFPSLETISCGGSLQNLKNLTIDCCPNIKTLFPDASQMPSSLGFLHIKHCEKLEKIVEGGEAPAGLEVVSYECPKYKGSPGSETSDWVMVDRRDASP